MSDRPDKKLLKWANSLANDPHEFTHVIYNQARSLQENDKRIKQLEAEKQSLLDALEELPKKWRKKCLQNECVEDSYSGCVGLVCPDEMADELEQTIKQQKEQSDE